MRRLALIVGISQYQKETGLSPLKAPVKDANALSRLLKCHSGFHVIALPPAVEIVDGEKYYPVAEHGKLTADELKKAIGAAFSADKNSAAADVLFYFSGHGVQQRGISTHRSFLACSDDKFALDLSDLAETIQKSAVKNAVVILDCCHVAEVSDFFSGLQNKSLCLIAASTPQTEALALPECSLLTEIVLRGLDPHRATGRVDTADLVKFINQYPQKPPQFLPPSGVSFDFIELTAADAPPPAEQKPKYDGDPYIGLKAFEEGNAAIFFGREQEIQKLLESLAQRRFVALLGASGSGKSSLVKAGVLPKLRGGHDLGKAWKIASMAPGKNPFKRLEHAISTGFECAVDDDLRTAADVRRVLDNHSLSPQQPLLLFIDQFEELFTECQDETARQAFIDLILAPASGLRVLLTLRADFLAQCSEYPALAQALAGHTLLTAPDAAGLRAAITQPLALVGMTMEEALATQLVMESQAEKGSLPLLQYALEQLWKAAQGAGVTQLRLELYQQLSANAGGGLRGLLNEKADEFYRKLEKEQAEQARLLPWLLVELTQAGENQEDTRKTVTVAELRQRQPARASEIEALLDTLIRKERLLTGDSNPAREATVTIAHEALLRDWGKLKDWLAASREVKGWRESFSQDLAAWQAGSPDNLLRGSRLATAETMLQKYADSLFIGDQQRAFIAASVQQRETEAQRRRARVRQAFAALVLGLVMVSGFAAWGWIAENRVQAEQKQRTISLFDSKLTHASLLSSKEDYAEAKAVLADTYPLDAEIQPSRRHARNLLASVTDILGGTGEVLIKDAGAALSGGLALSPDGKWLAAAGEHATVVLFNVDNQELKRLDGHDPTIKRVGNNTKRGNVETVVFASNGKWFVSAGEDAQIIVWSVPEGRMIAKWNAPADTMSLAVSPDNKTLASGDENKDITLWDISFLEQPNETIDGELSISIPSIKTFTHHIDAQSPGIATPHGLAFSPDGKHLASVAYDDGLCVWDISSGEKITMDNKYGKLTGVSFSLDGKTLATTGEDKHITLWSREENSYIDTTSKGMFDGHQDKVFGSTFTSDGQILASVSRDKTLRLWDIQSGVTLRILQGHTSDVWDVVARGNFLYTAGNDGTVRRWQLYPPNFKLFTLDKTEPTAIAVSPDGELVSVGFADGNVSLYSLPDMILLGTINAHNSIVKPIAFSADNRLFATTGGLDNLVKLWKIRKSEKERLMHYYSIEHTPVMHGRINSIDFSSDGWLIASASFNGWVNIFPVGSDKPLASFIAHSGSPVVSVKFSSNSKQLLTAGLDGFICMRDITTQSHVKCTDSKFTKGDLISITLSPNDNYVAAVGRDSNIRIYPLSENLPKINLKEHKNSVFRAFFSPDGEQLVTASGDATIRLWDLNDKGKQMFKLQLPVLEYVTSKGKHSSPIMDFSFHCTRGEQKICSILALLRIGKIVSYQLRYE